MSTTPNLALTYIASSQAQKEVTHNAALNDPDFMAQPSAINHTISTPAGSPSTGDTYIMGPSPTGPEAVSLMPSPAITRAGASIHREGGNHTP
jgi:hypothetical protein